MEKLKGLLDKCVNGTIMALIAFMVYACFLQVLSRYLFSSPAEWTEELSRYALVWTTFLGASIAVRNYSHLGVDFFVGFVPEKLNKIIAFLINLIIIIILFVVIYQGYLIVEVVSGQRSFSLGFSMGYVYAAVPVGALLMLIEYLWHLYRQLHPIFTEKEVA
jgi:TRAP-type C4-dicarboxylate transport system permease small subunit